MKASLFKVKTAYFICESSYVSLNTLPTNRKYIGSRKNIGHYWSDQETVNSMKPTLRTLMRVLGELSSIKAGPLLLRSVSMVGEGELRQVDS